MAPVQPPSDAYAPGWDLYEWALGYYASVTLSTAETMTLNFAPNETGVDSGLFAKDARITRLQYTLYIPTAQTSCIRIPGGITAPDWIRSPGWSSVDVTLEEIKINGRVVEDPLGNPVTPDPTDLSCYLVKQCTVPYVKLDSFVLDTIYNQKFQTRITHGTFNDDPEQNGQLVVEASDNSTLVFKYRGTDGIVRSATVVLT